MVNQSEHVLDMVEPPVFEDIPASAYEDYVPLDDNENMPADIPPAPTLTAAEITVEYYLRRYALTEPDAKVWDFDSHKLIKSGAFKNIIKPKIYTEWLNHPGRRTVALEDVEIDAAAAQKKGRGGLGEALRKYVYLNPSDTVWNKDTRMLLPVAHLKIAIADCYAMWVTHPEREEIPVQNFVFDPTQKVDVKTHINQFRGLALSPERDDKRCERIVRMLMALCNNDKSVFRWLRRWLAYPLINVGAKMATAVLCHSDVHGSGKSYFFDVVMRAIYGENSRTVGQAQLEGQYNDWMSKVLYCVYEEVLSRSQKYSHVGTIKQTITGKTVRIEKKFMSGWEEANHMNSVFLSNEVLPLPVEPSDRRFLVIWPETKLYEELQRGVDADLKEGGAAAFYQFLLDTKMQNDDESYPFDEHTEPPMTEAKERLIEHGRAVWEVFYNEWERGALEHNNMPVPFGSIRVSDLFKYFSAWCKINNEHSLGSKNFASFIGSKVKKRKDLNFNYKTFIGKATFFVVGLCPHDKTQEQWLGACVEGHSEILNKVEYIYDQKAA
jgi:putative DNA primase/helicase